MKLTGVEVSFDTVSALEPNTILVVISDQNQKEAGQDRQLLLAGWRSGFARGGQHHNGRTTAAKRMLCVDWWKMGMG